MTKPGRTLAALLAALALAGCAAKRIPGTEIQDTVETRAIVAVIDAYRKAVEARDARAVMALVSPLYFDDAGTADPADDMDYGQLERALPGDFEKLAGVRLEIGVKQVTVEGDQATAEVFYDGHFRVVTPRGEVAKAEADVQRMRFHHEKSGWRFVSGL
ncbi:MAG TPA: nuclear transport factor 2 family protein [Anaeromyxobacteraceae bacterium]|jgi:ketosteroid isomerase-like protein|nr:nuclear transport factor 2 family protein [Anaeromyxobacteraceae bacterium]